MVTKNKKNEKAFVLIISVILILALTTVFFYMRKNSIYQNRDRLIILCYQTNITGTDCEKWAESLKTAFPDIPDFEVTAYLTQEAGNSNMTITSEDGWSQIVIRLGAGQGDILFVDNEIFYSTLLENDMLVPLTGEFEKPLIGSDGATYGIDITGLTAQGLLNYGTSAYVGTGQPLPIHPAEHKDYKINGITVEPRVIAVIYKGSKHIEESQQLLETLFIKE